MLTIEVVERVNRHYPHNNPLIVPAFFSINEEGNEIIFAEGAVVYPGGSATAYKVVADFVIKPIQLNNEATELIKNMKLFQRVPDGISTWEKNNS